MNSMQEKVRFPMGHTFVCNKFIWCQYNRVFHVSANESKYFLLQWGKKKCSSSWDLHSHGNSTYFSCIWLTWWTDHRDNATQALIRPGFFLFLAHRRLVGFDNQFHGLLIPERVIRSQHTYLHFCNNNVKVRNSFLSFSFENPIFPY